MRKILLYIILYLGSVSFSYSQSYNAEITALKNFLVRMYNAEPFEGVQIAKDYENYYLLSVVTLTRRPNVTENAMNRVAQVKSMRLVSEYLNGTMASESQTIINSTDSAGKRTEVTNLTEIISLRTIGTAKSMQMLTTIDKSSTERVYIFFRKLDEMK